MVNAIGVFHDFLKKRLRVFLNLKTTLESAIRFLTSHTQNHHIRK